MNLNPSRYLGAASFSVAVAALAACGGSYYEVTDVGSGKSYYTRDVDRDDGSLRFKDEASGDKVTLGSGQIRKLTREQYQGAVRK